MSNTNFEKTIELIKGVNTFLGKTLAELNKLSYDDEKKFLLKYAINHNGAIFINSLVEMAVLVDKATVIKQRDVFEDEMWEPSKTDTNSIDEEWNRIFKNVGKKRLTEKKLLGENKGNKETGKTPS